ncbi:serine protease [Streptomyces sp. NPDC005236]|uniref:trypsin-like serine peptidase n=1 Tax=Streptomyces sp. NPDC005236 TaxID=3157028 RepID=UPI0033AAE0BF
MSTTEVGAVLGFITPPGCSPAHRSQSRQPASAYASRDFRRQPDCTLSCCALSPCPGSWKGRHMSTAKRRDPMSAVLRTRMELERQTQAAAKRYRGASFERQAAEKRLEAGTRFPDSPEALAARARRLLDRGGVPAAAVVESIRPDVLDVPDANERIIGVSKDLQAWSFLPRGIRAGGSIARISVRENGRELPLGTGFLVSPRLLMTNHHVLPDQESVQACFVEFNAQVTADNTPDAAVRLELDSGAFFLTDEHLDFTLVQIAADADSPAPGERFGWNRLSVQTGKLVIGEPVNVIGHPMGRLKEIAVRDNALQVRLDDFLHYKTDTEPGNSGSPVFNDQWEVVALHHSGVPKTDDQGRTLRKDGQIWQRGDGDDAIDYVSNEGVRVSSILKHLAAAPLGPGPRTLLAEMGADSGLHSGAVLPGPIETRAPVPAVPGREALAVRLGIAGRSSAFDRKHSLVFLHGRRQENKDPEVLRRKWSAGLNEGLTLAGITTVDPEDIWFPYYGDVLIQSISRHEAGSRPSAEAADEATGEVGAFDPGVAAMLSQLVAEAAEKEGMPQEEQLGTEGFGGAVLVGALRRQLAWLAAKTDLDEVTIEAILRDVAAYLKYPDVREAVLDCVLTTMPSTGKVTLVTHSLGTVVGMDLIHRLPPELEIELLVTTGSPLGMDAVYNRLLPPGPNRPDRVAHWFNAWCPTDTVAIGCPLKKVWTGELTDLAVANSRDRAHNIEEYLAHAEVAAKIGSTIFA